MAALKLAGGSPVAVANFSARASHGPARSGLDLFISVFFVVHPG
jgi:hypothetical protein